MTKSVRNESRFTLGSWVIFVFSTLFIAGAAAIVFQSYNQPTDGWYYDTGPDGQWITRMALSNSPTPLQPGDVVLTVAGRPVPAVALRPIPAPRGWIVGAAVPYVVLRAGQRINLAVPLVRRPLSAVWRLYEANGPLTIVVDLFWYLIGFGVFALRPRDTAARLLLLFTTFAATLTLIAQLDSTLTTYYYPPTLFWGTFMLNALWSGWYALIIHFALAFPVRKWPLTRHPRLTLAFLYGYAVIGTGGILILNLAKLVNLLSGLLLMALVITVLTVTIDNLRHVHQPAERAQLSWVALGICGPVLAVVSFPLQGLIPGLDQNVLNAIWAVLAGLLPLCLGIAITRFKLFGIYVLVRRTLVYTILTVLLGLVYFGGVTFLQSRFTGLSGQSSPAALVISTLLIAALFFPLRRRIQAFIDRRFYRRKYDVDRALEAFRVAARNEVELGKLTNELVAVAGEAMQPRSIFLWLKPIRVNKPQGNEDRQKA